MSTKDQILYYYAPLGVVIITLLSFLAFGFSHFLQILTMFAMGYFYMNIMNLLTRWYQRMTISKIVAGVVIIVLVMVCTGGFVYINLIIS